MCTGLPQEIDTNNNNEEGSSSGKCNEQDEAIWISNGGESTRPTQSNFCSREYNGVGCLTDAGCVETCFQEEYNYSEECSTCFGGVPGCSIDSGCMFLW